MKDCDELASGLWIGPFQALCQEWNSSERDIWQRTLFLGKTISPIDYHLFNTILWQGGSAPKGDGPLTELTAFLIAEFESAAEGNIQVARHQGSRPVATNYGASGRSTSTGVIPAGLRDRLKSTIRSEIAVTRLEAHIKSKGISLSEFSFQAGITERTLRTFRKTASVRHSTFDAIAKQIGMTRPELLKPTID